MTQTSIIHSATLVIRTLDFINLLSYHFVSSWLSGAGGVAWIAGISPQVFRTPFGWSLFLEPLECKVRELISKNKKKQYDLINKKDSLA